jgi:ketosteroid isomerase-like protein
MTSTILSNEEAAVRDAVERLNAAAREGDAAVLSGLIGEDLMYAHSNAKVESKAECIAALVNSKIDFEMLDGWTVQVYGPSALVHGKTIAHNPGGVNIPLHFMMMWVKDGGAWKLVGRHTAKLPA